MASGLQGSSSRAPVGIVGAGTMGVEIAAAHLVAGYPVRVCDHDPGVLTSARKRIAAELDDPADALEMVELAETLAPLAECWLVIESVIESREAKRPLLAELDALLPSDAILASNTSTLPLAELATPLSHPERFCGLHFCHPVRRRAAVELAGTQRTSPTVMRRAAEHVESLGKIPIRVADAPGFVVNRLLFPALSEALAMLLEGIEPVAIDRAARQAGMEKGPLELLDEIGLDVALRCGWELSRAMPDRVTASPLLVGLVKRGQLGRKSGAGIYSYRQNHGPAMPNPVLLELIAKWSDASATGATPVPQIARRLLEPMRAEADRLLAERVVADRRQIEQAAVDGLGFAAGALSDEP